MDLPTPFLLFINFNIPKPLFMFVYMLRIEEQYILLELLRHERLTNKELINIDVRGINVFKDDNDYYTSVRKLERWGLIHGSKFWSLTFKGKIRAKLIALDGNNPKDYTKGLKNEVVWFEFEYNH